MKPMKNSVPLPYALPLPFGPTAASVFTMLGAAALLTGVPSAHAQLDIDLTYIDKAGNANDTTGYGAVDYNYYIGTSEVTNGQYAAFLNSVAKSDPNALYNTSMAGTYGGITRSGESGSYIYTATRANAPVNYVSFLDAAAFLQLADERSQCRCLNGDRHVHAL